MIRFKKQPNGNVLVIDQNDNTIASYIAAMNVFKHPSQQNSLLISDDASAGETGKGLIISFASVDLAGCNPVITASNISDLIGELSNIFFLNKQVAETTTVSIPPFIGSVNPELLDIDMQGEQIEIFGSYFLPQTTFDLGANITVTTIMLIEANRAILLVDTGSQQQLNPITAQNGSADSFGEVFLETQDINLLIPGDQRAVLWENKTANITTGKGFIEPGSIGGWAKAATFSGVPSGVDFTLTFKILGLTASINVMVGMNTSNTTSGYTDIDFAFY